VKPNVHVTFDPDCTQFDGSAAAEEATTQDTAAVASSAPAVRTTPNRKQPCRSPIGTPNL
jgi:hypothetical protein